MNEHIYRKLSRHLDQLPEGFPPSSTGADLRLLELLFSPQEAELAVHLSLNPEDAGTIAGRAGRSMPETENHLEEMARKGLILSLRDSCGTCFYQAVPFVVGIYEFQVENLNDDLRNALQDYWTTMEDRVEPETTAQMRTIPVHESIDARLEALPYEQVLELVNANTRFAVAPCICRRLAKLNGRGCDAPEESCLIFGEWADFYIRTERAREINRAEMLALIAKADAANLVLQPSNSQRASFICCCCGCCCGVLRELQQHPRPADAVASAFISTLQPDLCEGCFTCLERCQMGALAEDGNRVALKQERCIGCGLCVSTCPTGALTLVRKPESARSRVPATMGDTWRIMREERERAGIR